jgi:carbamoyltransferase
MNQYVMSINPTVSGLGTHDPSAVLLNDGEVVFGVEEERYTRQKHAIETFPEQAIRACLDAADISLSDVSVVTVPWDPNRFRGGTVDALRLGLAQSDGFFERIEQTGWRLKTELTPWMLGRRVIEDRLREIDRSIPPIEMHGHHASHAASAFYPTSFDEALILTLDARGESEATSIWRGTEAGLERLRTYDYTNSLGYFYGAVTKFLGFYPNNGEGKVMGLAPYGEKNRDIRGTLRDEVETGIDYDVSSLSQLSFEHGARRIEELFDRPRKTSSEEFTQWEKDLAFEAQALVEEIVTDIVETYCARLGTGNVGLAGGVALNCKMNKQVMELDCVDELFIQPVSNDAGSAIGAGMLEYGPQEVAPTDTVYWGPGYSTAEIEERLQVNKIDYTKPDDLTSLVAEKLAEGALVGWFQGRLEMGPRALGNRSILADPRTTDSLDRVNEFVKHREAWRPFAPSMLAEAGPEYLENSEESSYMIKTFDPKPEKRDNIAAVLHPADQTTRPQTVRPDQNARYHELIEEFERITGVPVVLNTSFNDHGEPIINTPTEALKDFYGMGLDVLVLEDILVEKEDIESDHSEQRVTAESTGQTTD